MFESIFPAVLFGALIHLYMRILDIESDISSLKSKLSDIEPGMSEQRSTLSRMQRCDKLYSSNHDSW
jgi:hypothetical protein